MRSRNLLAIALAVCFLLTSCANSRPPVTAPPKPLPAASVQLCPLPPAVDSNKGDDLVAALKQLLDMYGTCAGRLVELLDWLDDQAAKGTAP